MTIALVDDSSKDISLLYEYVCRYCNEHKLHMSIKQFTHEKSFFNTLKTEKYDLVFLDIFMQEQNGMLIAKEVKKFNPKCQIIFSTSSKDHAVKAFRLHALDYLLKPYTYARLEDSLNRFENTAARFAHYIELKAAVKQKVDIHAQERNIFCVAFSDGNDKKTMSQAVSGRHIKDNRSENNSKQTYSKIFQRK